MPRATKGKAKKDTTSEATKTLSNAEELFDALTKEDRKDKIDATNNTNDVATINNNEEDNDDVEPAIATKASNGKTVGRGKKAEKVKVEKEEKPAKKATASRGRGGKKAAAEDDVEVTGKETDNVVEKASNGDVELDTESEPKEEAVTTNKAKGGRGGKRGAKASAPAVVENGDQASNGVSDIKDTEKEEKVVAKAKGRGGKKTAKASKDEAVEEVVAAVAEEPATKVSKAKAGGRKKKVEEKTEPEPVPVKEEQADEPEPPKKKGRAAASKKSAAKEPVVVENSSEASEIVLPAKKATKRGAKDSGAKEKEEVEKVPPKKARGSGKATKNSKTEEAAAETPQENGEAPVEAAIPKKRGRKEPSVEKEIKTEAEKPKKGRGGKRKAADKAVEEEEEPVVETKQVKEEATAEVTEETTTTTTEKPTTSRGGGGGRKRAAPSTNKTKKTAADANKAETNDKNVDEDKATVASNHKDVGDDEDEDEADGSKRKLDMTCGTQLKKLLFSCFTATKAKKKKDSPPLNSTSTTYNKADFDLPPLPEGQTAGDEPRFNLKISSWNVAGLRSWLKKEGLKFLEYEEPDIFCLQETKCTTDQLPEEVQRIPGYHPYWLCMPGGYAGVAIYSKIMPINVEYGIGNKEFDDAGRIITAEYEKFFLINVYVPNSGRKLVNLDARMKWEKLFQEFVEKLNARKPLVICGDMNVSHQEIDLANPKTNTRNAGFTKEERDKMSELLALGYIDTFRHLYPDRKGAYTFWTYMGNARSRNVGWRLDYFLVSERFVKKVVDNCIRSQCMGSDHCPITLFLKL
ncbi:recombination repair protein 1 isoform X1 [Musca domestica]|uniref:exodeoxyribonuclease III n=1 Tax=Musca domestica TaxID=7370 RepID=A0ABM3V5T8_MUSDO|nr:recombination repair protein 1 isoform X1 [Musca domestica]